jgi:hypothetical protein
MSRIHIHLVLYGFIWFYMGKYPLEMEVLDGFMGKSWEYMGIPSAYDIHSLPWFFDGPNRNRCFAEL